MLLFFGNYTDTETYRIITENKVRELSQAARLFQERLISGIGESCEEFEAYSILPTRKGLIYQSDCLAAKQRVHNITYTNKSILNSMREVRKIVKTHIAKNENVIVLTYAINPIVVIPLLCPLLRKKISFVNICPELPQLRRYEKGLKEKVKKHIYTILNSHFDKYIVFSKEMEQYLPSNREIMVLEGFAPDNLYSPVEKNKNIAFYAGGLASDNGITLMMDAAEKSALIDELWICGVGECLEDVKNRASKRIKYLGRLNNSEVIELERSAKVLLNLRNPENQLTKFSFPSKVMEYMASGSLILSTKLQGIPYDYYPYITMISTYSVSEVADKMDYIFSLSENEYRLKAQRALKFVERKQSKYRIAEILAFIH